MVRRTLLCLPFCAAALPAGADAAETSVTQEITALGAVFLENSEPGKNNNKTEGQALYTFDADIFLTDQLAADAAFYVRGSDPSSLAGGPMSPNQSSMRSPYTDIIELGLKWQDDDYGIKVGKFLQNYEFADFLSVLNRYNLSDFTNPLRPVKAGNWLAQGSLVFEPGTLSLTVMPFHPSSGRPADSSRWSGIDSNGNFSDSDDFNTSDDAIQQNNDVVDITLIWQGTTEDFDYLLGVGSGQSLYGVTTAKGFSPVTVNEKPKNINAFGGIAYPLDGVRLYGETYYQSTRDGRDDDFLRVVGGMAFDLYEYGERFGFNDLKFTVEGLLDKTMRSQSNAGYRGGSSDSRPLQDSFAFDLSAELNDDWSAAQSILWGTEKDDVMSMTRLTWNASDSTSVNARLVLFDGTNNESAFGEWRNNDYVGLDISHKF